MLSSSDGPLLSVFAAVVRHGSFSRAALELKLSKSVVSERIRVLEERCGVRLLERTTRKLSLTSSGAEVMEAATGMEDALALVSRNLEVRRSEPGGVLRISTTSDLGPLLVGPVVSRFVCTFPKVRVEVFSEDAQRDVLESQVDLAVRLGTLKESSFKVRTLAIIDELIVAAPRLASRFAAASSPHELMGAPWVKHSLVSGATLRFEGPERAREEIAPEFRAEANAGATVISLLLQGAGVGVMPAHVLHEELRAGRLVRLCPSWIRRRLNLYALTPSSASSNAALSAFVDMLQGQVRSDPARWHASTSGAA